jgi:hypothetical protein
MSLEIDGETARLGIALQSSFLLELDALTVNVRMLRLAIEDCWPRPLLHHGSAERVATPTGMSRIPRQSFARIAECRGKKKFRAHIEGGLRAKSILYKRYILEILMRRP